MSSAEQDQVMGHADEADGIEEYDNRLPAWWLGLFYFTVIVGVAYGIHYHFIGKLSQAGLYEAEVQVAQQRWPAQDPASLLEVSPEAIAAGAEVYAANCVGCHGPELAGGIGPNLKDREWIHGGSLGAIQTTITEGVPAKGMLAWGPILGPQKVAQVSAFVHSQGGGE